MKCPRCGSSDTRRATVYWWQCLTCDHEWLDGEPEAGRDDPPPALRDDAASKAGQEAPGPGAAERRSRSAFGRVSVILDLDGNTQTLAHSDFFHLNHMLTGEKHDPVHLAIYVHEAISEALAELDKTTKLFGCQVILEQIEAEAPKGGVSP